MSPCFAAMTCGVPEVTMTVDVEPDELSRDLDKALGASFRPAILDRDGATLHPAELTQSLRKSIIPLAFGRTRALAQKPDGPQLPRLLRLRRERPGGR
jgi:hypothetical protein